MINNFQVQQNGSNQFSQTEISQALEISGMAIWEYDLKTKKVKFNENWFLLIGYDSDELPSEADTFYQLLHPDDKNKLEDLKKQHLEHNPHGILEFQYRMKTKSGNWKWLRNRSKLIYNEYGEPLKWVGSILDISRLKESENQVIQKNQHINSVVNSLSDIIYEIDEDYTPKNFFHDFFEEAEKELITFYKDFEIKGDRQKLLNGVVFELAAQCPLNWNGNGNR